MAQPRLALLVSGFLQVQTGGSWRRDVALSRLEQLLRASSPIWRVTRLAAEAADADSQPSSPVLKHHLASTLGTEAEVALVVVSAALLASPDGPRLVTGRHASEFPDDASLPLAWLGTWLRATPAERAAVVLQLQGDEVDPAEVLDALEPMREGMLVAAKVAGEGPSLLESCLAGLQGAAVDRRSGNVTLATLNAHLADGGAATRAAPPGLGSILEPPARSRRIELALETARGSGSLRAAPVSRVGWTLPGRIRVDELIAMGSFGAVYRGRQLTVNRDVAVKVMHPPGHDSAAERDLFFHEVEIVGRLRHPNVVQIYHADVSPDGDPFFAMELLEGRTLRQIIDEASPLPVDRARRLMIDVLSGVRAAHAAGVVHADLKPENVIVVPDEGGDRAVVVDFGLSRLHVSRDEGAESLGGTPSYMAPEQLFEARVGEATDVYSAALILLELLTGWRRRKPGEPLVTIDEDLVPDAPLRRALLAALEEDPGRRLRSAGDFLERLGENPAESASKGPEPPSRPPFRGLTPFLEADHTSFHGRDREIGELVDRVLHSRVVVYTAPSGTGKSSLLRAGLVPRLHLLNVHAVYVNCRANAVAELLGTLDKEAADLRSAVASWCERHDGRSLVLVLDQLEAELTEEDSRLFREIEAVIRHVTSQCTIVLCVREDFLPRLVERQLHQKTTAVLLRLGPLSREGARAALERPLAERRMRIQEALLDRMIDDLEHAAAQLQPALGWRQGIYPAHLQLAAAVLYEAAGPKAAIITLDHYRAVGGLAAIVGEHFERVLDRDLPREMADIARELFLRLVTASTTRRLCAEDELIAALAPHAPDDVRATLAQLHHHGLLLPSRDGDHAAWELTHDSLVPRVLAWVDARDLARRRARELVEYRLRRSTTATPSLLTREELREVQRYPAVVMEIESDRARREADDGALTPTALVTQSRRAVARRNGMFASAIALVLLVAGLAVARWERDRRARAHEESLRAGDIGRFELVLVPFDWDAGRHAPLSPDAPPALTFRVLPPSPSDPDEPAEVGERDSPRRSYDASGKGVVAEAPAGPAFLEIERGPCPPAIVRLRWLPGYAQRGEAPSRLEVRVPTCQATLAGTVAIPAGVFIYGGPGEGGPRASPAPLDDYVEPEERVDLSGFRIDRTETTNAAYAHYATMAETTGRPMPIYPKIGRLVSASGPDRPVTNVDWTEARDFCRFMGKDLPTSEQWEKAARGGLALEGGAANPAPRRIVPWGRDEDLPFANLQGPDDGFEGVAPVGSFPKGASPYGVLDLAGNAFEWTRSRPNPSPSPRMRITRGGSWDTPPELRLHTTVPRNMGDQRFTRFDYGFRCVTHFGDGNE